MTCFNVDLVTRWPCDPMKNKSDNKNTSCRTQPELLCSICSRAGGMTWPQRSASPVKTVHYVHNQ